MTSSVVSVYTIILITIYSCQVSNAHNIFYGDEVSDFIINDEESCFNSTVKSKRCDETVDSPICMGICGWNTIQTQWISTRGYQNVTMQLTLVPYLMDESTSNYCEILYHRQGEAQWTQFDTVSDPNAFIDETFNLYQDNATFSDDQQGIAFLIRAYSSSPSKWCYLSYLSIDGLIVSDNMTENVEPLKPCKDAYCTNKSTNGVADNSYAGVCFVLVTLCYIFRVI